jgi:UDP-glucuronate 4-epimerase
MRVLLTGGAGFIGYHCAERLLRSGHSVHVVDSVNEYYRSDLKWARLARLRELGLSGFSHSQLEDGDALNRVFAEFQPEQVLHLAAQAGVRYSLSHPQVYAQANVVGTLNVLEACRHHGLPRLVYASSSSVYGGNTELPFSIRDRVDAPISLYAASKKACELMAHTYSHLFGLQTIGLRFFTVYGPWGRPDMALWLFADAILQGRPIRVFNHGDMYRDFTWIGDIVEGVMACLDRGTLKTYELFNLGNHRSEHLLRLISLIEDQLGRTAIKELLPMQPGDVRQTYADISESTTALGFHPSTPIDVGVPRFLEWFLAHPQFHTGVSQ